MARRAKCPQILELHMAMQQADHTGEGSVAESPVFARYKRVFDVSPIGVAITTPEGRFLDVNDVGLRMFGMRREEVLGRTAIELRLVDPWEASARAEFVARACEAGTACREERIIRSKTGELFRVALTVHAVDLEGAPHLVTTFLDVTDQKIAADLLAASEERHRRIVETAHEGIVVVDPQGRVSFTNRRMDEMLGYTHGEMLRTTLLSHMHTDTSGEAALYLERVRRGTSEAVDLTLRRKDGAAAWAHLGSSPLLDKDGRRAGTLLLVLDVTERRRAEEELRRSEAQLREAQEVAHVGSWELDLRTRTVTRSAELCRIFGVDAVEYRTGPTFSDDRIHPADRARFKREMEAAFSHGKPYAFDCRIVRPDGEVRHVSARGRVECDADGQPVRLLGTGQDVTDRKLMEARLLLADRMASLGTLAAGAAHEINNPLSYVVTNLELAVEELESQTTGAGKGRPRDVLALLRQAQEGAERVRRVVRGLRLFARADEERRTQVDVRHALGAAVDVTSNEVRHRARLVTDLGSTPLVEADEARLAQVFINVLVNAAQAMPVGRAATQEIRIATSTDANGRAVVEISDDGPGMPQELAERVFDPFFTTKGVGEGLGLGLSICHGIVTALGGEISVESAVGKGTVVRVVLPPASRAVGNPAAPAVVHLPDSEARRRVLIVDDDARIAGAIGCLLDDDDVTILTDARTARDRVLAGERFDVILCDLMMPEMTGMELHEALAAAAPEQAARMLFLTGGAFTPSSRAFLERVPNECIEKPFDPAALRASVSRLAR
jgi:PAS domain S-box-containing protein